MIKRFQWVIVAFAAVCGIIANEFFADVLARSTSLKTVSDILQLEIPVSAISLGIFLIGVLAASLSYFSKRLEHSEAEVLRLSSEVAILKSTIHDLNQIKYTDRTTRIPNEQKWEEEISKIGGLASSGKPFHLAMIDLMDFGSLNEKIGYSATDEIIREIAQDIFQTMRRREVIYKADITDSNERYFIERLYRKHSGGDEFLLITEGPEYEALGLLNRIAEKAEKFTAIAAAKGVDWKFGFHAGVCPIERNDDKNLARKRVEDCLVVAKRSDTSRHFYWYSEISVDDDKDEKWKSLPDFAKNIYRKSLHISF